MTDTDLTAPEAVERFDLEQPTEHMGSASMKPEPGYGDWVRYTDYAALSAALEAERAENLSLWQANEELSSAAWTATTRTEALDAKLKEAGEHIEAVSDAFAKQIGVRRHHAWPIIRAARAFLASLGDKP